VLPDASQTHIKRKAQKKKKVGLNSRLACCGVDVRDSRTVGNTRHD